MKKIVFIFLFLTFIVNGNKDYELFLKGNHLVHLGSLKEALDSYNQIKTKSSGISYNKAIVLYGLERYSEAFAACCQAEIKAEGDLAKKVRHAKCIIQDKLGLPHDSWLHTFFLDKQSGLWLGFWQLLCFLLLSLIIYIIYFYNYKNSCLLENLTTVKLSRNYQIVLLFSLFFYVFIKIFSYYYVRQPYVVIVSKDAPVCVGPREEFDKIGMLSLGVCAELVDENDAWCKIYSSDIKSRGWIQKKDVCIVEDYN